jgi:hypothetical protein
MENKILSYSFFVPKSLNSHMRFWDRYNTQDRYWFNLPALISVNSVFYPDFIQRIHISKNVKEHFLYSILVNISENFEKVELVEMDYDYENTEPTMWRYKPLFNKECDLVLCRDIDSLPNTLELKASKYFIDNQNFFVHTMRTHTNHTTPPTIILAGLCGYRPKLIPFLQGVTFEQYYTHFKNPHWGLDQNSLIGIFTQYPQWTSVHFLDTPLSSSHHRVGNPLIPCKSFDQDFLSENVLMNEQKELLVFLDRETIWPGEPIDIRGDKLNELLSFNNSNFDKMRECLMSCTDEVKNFYLN